MKLKNSDLEAIISGPSYQKLFTSEFDDILLVLEIRRQNEDLKPAIKAYTDTKKTLIERYCDKDGKTGKPVSAMDGQFSFRKNPDNFVAFREKYVELLDTEIEVGTEKVKIPSKAMNNVAKWSGADLSAIYNIVEILRPEDQDSKVKHLNSIPKVKSEV